MQRSSSQRGGPATPPGSAGNVPHPPALSQATVYISLPFPSHLRQGPYSLYHVFLEMEPSLLTALTLFCWGYCSDGSTSPFPTTLSFSGPDFAECVSFLKTQIRCYVNGRNSCNFVSLDLCVCVLCGDLAVVKDISVGIHSSV